MNEVNGKPHVPTNIRIKQWAAVFKAKAESGLTVDEYCEQNGISRNAYYYWLRKAKASALEHTRTAFVELETPETETCPQTKASSSSFVPQLTIEKKGFAIGVGTDVSKELFTVDIYGDNANIIRKIFLNCCHIWVRLCQRKKTIAV